MLITEIGGGLTIEVADNGSARSTPVVKGDIYASDGHGLYLVQTQGVGKVVEGDAGRATRR